ncbi:MAG: polysaccharide deacetylase family protein [Kiritimatiellia bacterium]|jgi:peptidoglycan/xylan/chitin deacetylase (PgdA/CDA1 family)
MRAVVAAAVVLLVVFVGIRLRVAMLPSVEVPILLYERIGAIAVDAVSVPQSVFYRQMRDLSAKGYRTVSPARLRAYAEWGVPLPAKPIVITFDNAYRNLLVDVAPILREQQFTAVVNLATTFIAENPSERRTLNGEPMMTWTEIRAAIDEGVFSFGGHTRNRVDLRVHEKPFNEIRASRSDLKRATGYRTRVFSYPFGSYTPEIAAAAREARVRFAMINGGKIASIGPQTDFLALPRIKAAGGNHLFTMEVFERRGKGTFGYVKVVHDKGPTFASGIHVFDADAYEPLVIHDVPELKADSVVEIPIPSDVAFPVTIEIRDPTGVLLYHAATIERRNVIKDAAPGQSPLSLEGGIEIKPLK